jgi:hypothetical protein
MKKLSHLILSLFLFMVSCVTGNDDSQVLEEHQKALETTPRVLNLQVNGVEMKRDSLSHWIPVAAVPGDILTITFILDSGNGATSSVLQYSRYYHYDFTPFGLQTGVDPGYELIIEEVYPEGETEESITYVVPELDDDGFEFFPGDVINIAFWTENTNGSVGYNDFNIQFE